MTGPSNEHARNAVCTLANAVGELGRRRPPSMAQGEPSASAKPEEVSHG